MEVNCIVFFFIFENRHSLMGFGLVNGRHLAGHKGLGKGKGAHWKLKRGSTQDCFHGSLCGRLLLFALLVNVFMVSVSLVSGSVGCCFIGSGSWFTWISS